jgi:hypothetical protein
MNGPPVPFDQGQRASDDDRERVVEVLRAAMAKGRLDPEEFETRIDSAYRARTLADLLPIIEDLSTESQAVVAPRTTSTEVDRRIGGKPGSHVSLAVLGSVERSGGWVVPLLHSSFSYLGNVRLDLRESRFAKRRSTITAVSLLGSVRVVVPRDASVRTDGLGIVGNFSGPSVQGPEGSPEIRVRGLALWGEVVVIRESAEDYEQRTDASE